MKVVKSARRRMMARRDKRNALIRVELRAILDMVAADTRKVIARMLRDFRKVEP